MGDPHGLWPLYRRDEIADAQRVFLVEGEKCADIVARLKLAGTTSAHGATAAKKTDWAPLAGKELIIMPDHDEAGENYRDDVVAELGKLVTIPIIKVLDLGLKGKGDDIEQWLGTLPESWSNEVIARELNRLADQAPAWKSPATKAPILKRGKWVSCQYNSRLWLEQQGLGDKIRLDRFKGIISVDDKPLDDTMIISMNGQIEASQRTRWSQEHVRSALIDIGNEHAYSPLTDWLDTLQWDGESRLDLFFRDAYQCELDPYTTACARVLFLSAVARAYQPGCQTDVMVVLIGPQGIFKSTGMKALCHDPSWFTDNIGDISDRKIGEDLQGKWIVEFSEFSRINRATADVTKGFLTRTSDWFRPAYGRVSKDHHRSCVFVGTSNTEELLQDTENRRYMPIHCKPGNIAWIKSNRDQLWAEAVSRYRAGEKHWIEDKDVLEACRRHQNAARNVDAWEDILREEFAGRNTIALADILDALGLKPDRYGKSEQIRVGIALKALGFKRARQSTGERDYYWERARQ